MIDECFWYETADGRRLVRGDYPQKPRPRGRQKQRLPRESLVHENTSYARDRLARGGIFSVALAASEAALAF